MSDAPSRAGYKGALFARSTGKPYRQWRQAMRNYLSGQADKSGSSCADHVAGLDMGGAAAGAPALPGGAGMLAVEMAALRLVRARKSYTMLLEGIAPGDLYSFVSESFFQDGM